MLRGEPLKPPGVLYELNGVVMSDKEVASVHVQAKLTPSEFRPFLEVMNATGIKKATLIRNVILSKSPNETVIQNKQSPDAKKLIFLVNNAANNINQIARKLNVDHKNGVVSEKTYQVILNQLIGLDEFNRKLLDNVSKSNNRR